jgi:hypothetical protein
MAKDCEIYTELHQESSLARMRVIAGHILYCYIMHVLLVGGTKIHLLHHERERDKQSSKQSDTWICVLV